MSIAKNMSLIIMSLLLGLDSRSIYSMEYNMDIFKATKIGNLDRVRQIIKEDPGAVNRGSNQWTPLHNAAAEGQLAIAQELIFAGANVNSKDCRGASALLSAVERGDIDIVKALIAAGAEINSYNYYHETPLYCAVNKHLIDIDIVKALIDAGAKVDSQVSSKSPIHIAAKKGHIDTVKALIAAGVEINSLDDYKRTPLYYAVDEHHIAVVKALIDAGAIVDSQDVNADYLLLKMNIYDAIWTGDLTRVRQFIKQDPEIINWLIYGQTPLYLATAKGALGIVNELIAAGAGIDSRSEGLKETPLHYAVRYDHVAIMKALIDAGANVNLQTINGDSILHYVVEYNHVAAFDRIAVMQALIATKADVNICDRGGRTALHWAVESKDVDSVKALIGAGANVDLQDNDGNSPLHRAFFTLDLEIIQALIDGKANVNIRDKKGKSPLDYVEFYDTAVAKILIDAGANLDLKKNDYEGLLMSTIIEGEVATTQKLIAYGAKLPSKQEWIGTPHMSTLESIRSINPNMAELITDYIDRIEQAPQEAKKRIKPIIQTLALAMHPRLGNESPFSLLSPSLLQYLSPFVISAIEAQAFYEARQPRQHSSNSGCVIC